MRAPPTTGIAAGFADVSNRPGRGRLISGIAVRPGAPRALATECAKVILCTCISSLLTNSSHYR